MKKGLLYMSGLLALATIKSYAATSVEAFVTSHSFSNILPIKQLIEDDWQQAPKQSASDAFTQNEVGVRAYFDNFSFSVSQRYDYFVQTNDDAAKAFYLDRNDLALDSQSDYAAQLRLFHQRSNGIKVGYKLNFDRFSAELRVGYWRVLATRESQLNGLISSDLNGNISADAQLSEFYSTNNFLKRQNSDDWNTQGSGVTVDLHMRWQPSNNIDISVDITDLYSDYKVDNAGFSKGKIDTDGTFINSIGGIAYVPLYRGIETAERHNFELPETVNLDAIYRTESLAYVTHFTRQGDINFYYVGVQFESENSTTRLLFDIENTAPEIQFHNKWITAYFSIDDTDIDQAMLAKLGVNVHLEF